MVAVIMCFRDTFCLEADCTQICLLKKKKKKIVLCKLFYFAFSLSSGKILRKEHGKNS